MHNFESSFQRQKTSENFYKNQYKKDKENLDDNINKYFNQFEEKRFMTQKSKTQVYDELQKEQEFLMNYEQKLLQVYTDIYKLEGNNQFKAMQEAQKTYQKEQKKSILPIHLLDPLVEGYERKTKILTEELKQSNQELKKIAKITKLLLQDNKQLRESQNKKNQNFKDLMQKISFNENDNNSNLQQQIKFLENQIQQINIENQKLQEQNQYHRSYSNQGQKEINEQLQKIQELQDQLYQQTWQLKNLQEYKFKTQPILNDLESQVTIFQKQQQKEQMLLSQLQNEKKILQDSYKKIKQKYEELEEEQEQSRKKNYKEKIELQNKIDQLIEDNLQIKKQVRKKDQEIYSLQNQISENKIYEIPNESVVSQFEPSKQIQITQAESIVHNQVKKNLLEQFQNDSNNYFDFTEYEQKYK